jgi:MscS family membrane protein
MKKFNISIALFLLFSVLGFGQLNNAPVPTLETPHNTMYIHLYYLQPESYQPEISAEAIPTEYDSLTAIKRAIQIKQILDGKGLFVRLNQLPQEPEYRDSITQKYYYTPFPNQLPEIYLERINEKWYYSRESTELVPGLHKKVFPLGSDILLKILPRKASATFLGLAVWQYLGIGLILFLCFFIHFLLSRMLRPFINLLTHRKMKIELMDKESIWKLARYISLVLIVRLAAILLPALQLPIKGSEFTHKALAIITTILFILIGLLIVGVFSERAKNLALKTENKMDEQLLPIIDRIFKILIILGGVFYILRLLDVNITALIAGISIGGLALALAAQDTVKNLIGSVMIFVDRPFQVEDYIIGSGFEGTVDEVGFRSTRIRTIDTSIISVPNGSLANMSVTNLGVRVFRILNTTLTITYNTPPDLIEQFIAGLKEMILENPKISDENYYVHFRNMSDSSLDIMFRCYLDVEGYAEELAERERVLLRILRMAESLGIQFAFPSSSIYVEQFPQKD